MNSQYWENRSPVKTAASNRLDYAKQPIAKIVPSENQPYSLAKAKQIDYKQGSSSGSSSENSQNMKNCYKTKKGLLIDQPAQVPSTQTEQEDHSFLGQEINPGRSQIPSQTGSLSRSPSPGNSSDPDIDLYRGPNESREQWKQINKRDR